MTEPNDLEKVKHYFAEKLKTFGSTHRAADYNSVEEQETRFFQLTKVIDARQKYSLLDFGGGYGAMYDFTIIVRKD